MNLQILMGLLCACPKSTEITDIPNPECLESVGQIQKIVFQRLYSETAGELNSFTIASTNPNVLATWTTVLTASDNTKVQCTPYISAPVVEPGAARETGGGNESVGGIAEIIGREPTTFTGMLKRAPQSVIAALKTYQCENVGVYLIDEFGRIIGLTDSLTSPTKFYPIPIAGLFIGDKKLGGLEEVDSNSIAFKFLPNWSDKLHIVTPVTAFNALSALNS